MRTVPLHGPKAAGRVALVDDEDYDLVMRHKWWVDERENLKKRVGPYAATKLHVGVNRYANLYMHVLIMGVKGIDHADHYGLNNQRSNLRAATTPQNHANQRKTRAVLGKPTSSRFKGVTWDKRSSRWSAQITVNRRYRSLGRFADEVQAARAYDSAAREAFGEFACLNFPEPCERGA